VLRAQEQIGLQVVCVDKGNEALKELIKSPSEFSSKQLLDQYLSKDCLSVLWSKGYLAASVDSLVQAEKKYIAYIFLGEQYAWGELKIGLSERAILPLKWNLLLPSVGKMMKPSDLTDLSQQLLDHLEESGHPFASVRFDSSYWNNQQLHAVLKIDAGPRYQIDSIRIDSKMHINPVFLSRYLGIQPQQLYKKSLLASVSKRLEDLGYLQEYKPWDLSLYGSGSTLNLYLKAQRSNRFDLLLGLMPSNPLLGGKAQFTGDGNMELNNAFGNGEQILLNWQQLQIQSPRLHLYVEKPFLLNSNIGLAFDFNLLKKDSSYINLMSTLGLQYALDQRQMIKFQLKQYISNVLYVDTQLIKQSRNLQSFLDLSNTQLALEWVGRGTNDRWNPTKGTAWSISISSGLKKIRKQEAILSIQQDLNGNGFDYSKLYDAISLRSVQSSFLMKVDRFNPLGRYSTLKTSLHAAGMYGRQLFLNELYQIGGIKTLRGFDEESIFASSYAIGSLEYRYLLDRSSNIFGFIDMALVEKSIMDKKENSQFLGAGLGLNVMTKTGLFTLAYALGKTEQQAFGVKTSKIHVGFSTMF
jgi:outer membrane protein assembly factor BamA